MPDPPKAARDRATQLELLVGSVADYAIFLLDPGGHVATWNLGAEKIKGYQADEIIGRHFSTFYTEEDRARDHPADELEIALRDGRFEEEGWRVRKDGTRFWANVVITAVRTPDGSLAGFGKVTRDLTARRATEEGLRRSADELRAANDTLVQFRRMVEAVRDYAIFMLEPDGRIATWNVGARNIKGYTADEAIGRHFSMFYTEEDRAAGRPERGLSAALAQGGHTAEGWRVRKDGTRLWASVTITPLRDDEGHLRGFSKVTRDLSERRENEQRLREARDELQRSNAELERFAVVAAHDLREPLTTIGSFVRLVQETEASALSARGRAHLGKVAEAVGGMRDLIEDLLMYARLGRAEVELERVALRPAVDRVLERLHASIVAHAAEVAADVPEDAAVLVDRLGVDVVLQNLLANAIKFGAPGGPHVAIGARWEDGGWTLSVTDDGRGIDPADQARIFGAFERVRGPEAQTGQGLGLSICHRVAERSGGRLGVDSAPGEGSRFWCWLPAAPPG